MAVYNKIGGGSNRVTLDGKPPTERVNLKSINTFIARDNIFQMICKEYFFKDKDVHYVVGTDNYLYKFKFGEELTRVDTNSMEDFKSTMVIKEGNALYTVKANASTFIEIYKTENGNCTLIKRIRASSLKMSGIWSVFNLGKTIYILALTTNDVWHVFISNDFGTTITDITKQIVILDNLNLRQIASYFILIYKNVLFVQGDKYLVCFDGKTLKKLTNIDWDSNSSSLISEGHQCTDAPIFATRIKYENVDRDTVYTHNIHEFVETTNGISVKKIDATFKVDRHLNKILVNGKRLLYPVVEGGKDFLEYPVKAYIEDREKG